MTVKRSVFIDRSNKRNVIACIGIICPYHKVAAVNPIFCNNIHNLRKPVRALTFDIRKPADTSLCNCKQFSVSLRKLVCQPHRICKISTECISFFIRYRIRIIRIKPDHIHIAVTRIPLFIFVNCCSFRTRTVYIEQIVHLLFISQIFHRVLKDTLISLRIAERFAPPEPASRILMEWSEKDRAVYLMRIFGNHIQISGEPFMVSAAWKDLIHAVPGQIVGIRRQIIVPVICLFTCTLLFLRVREIRHMRRKCHNRATLQRTVGKVCCRLYIAFCRLRKIRPKTRIAFCRKPFKEVATIQTVKPCL